MFNFIKKATVPGVTSDKEDKEKRKRDKKDRKEKQKRERANLSAEELLRLDEVRRSLKIRGRRKDKEKLPSGITADYTADFLASLERNESPISTIPGSPSHAGHQHDGYTQSDSSETSLNSVNHKNLPPLPPKPPKRGILKTPRVSVTHENNREPADSNGFDLTDDHHHSLVRNTLQNELITYQNLPPQNGLNGKHMGSQLLVITSTSPSADSLTDTTNSSFATPPFSLSPVGESQGFHRWSRTANFDDVNLPLPDIVPLVLPRPRTLTIPRQKPPRHDFGFSLRRAMVLERVNGSSSDSGVSMRAVIFAEPGTMVQHHNETGLLPGDKLLEVNGFPVEDKTREDIIDMIKASGDSVTLKVQPVAELSELSRRSGHDGGEVHLADSNIRGGTLKRSGSRRFNKSSTAKSEAHLAQEKLWLDAEKVWLMHRGGFAAARKESGQQPEPGKLRVRLDATGDGLCVDEDDIEKANPPQFDRAEDLASLRHLNESSILHTLRQRYATNLIHTYAGSGALLVINPMAPLAIYSEKVVSLFKGCKTEDMPPHIYSMAQSAYHSMLSTRRDQSLVFAGRSGSGKTSNFRHCVQYLLTAAGTVNKALTLEKMTALWIVLESFGNCKTAMNGNATRFSQIFSLDFDQSGAVACASLQVLMLEKTRIVRKVENETTFHIMHRLLSGVEGGLRKELLLENLSGNENNPFMSLLQKHEDKQRAQQEFVKVCNAFNVLGITEGEQKVVLSVLAAIFHLGCAGAVKAGNNNRYQFASPQNAQRAAHLLGTTVEELSRVLFGLASGMSTPNAGPRTPFRTPSPTDKGLDKEAVGLEAIEGIVIGLYAEVFNCVASLINRSIATPAHTVTSILLVDSPGFQNPATCGRQTGASFEDLCHNYLQERLQLLFHHTNLVAPRDRYLQENIDFTYDENENENLINPTPLVNLLDKTAQNTVIRTSQTDLHEGDRRGLLWLLDEEAMYPGSSDESFLERLFTHYGERDHQLLLRKAPGNNQFILQHLQGTNPVLYSAKGWLKRSRENPVARAAVTLLQESCKEELSKLFVNVRGLGASSFGGSLVGIDGTQSLRRASSIRRTCTAGTAAIKGKSVCLQTKFTVDSLVETLRRTKLRFVHCLLPQHNAGLCETNASLMAVNTTAAQPEDSLMNVPLLRSQIRGGQILDAVRLYKQGYPNFLPLGEFRRRFRLLAGELKAASPVLDERKAVEDMLLTLDLELSSYRVGLSQLGKMSGIRPQNITGKKPPVRKGHETPKKLLDGAKLTIKPKKKQSPHTYENLAFSRSDSSDKLRRVIDNFDKILDEYKEISATSTPVKHPPPKDTKIPKLVKAKTCSIIESKCILKKSHSQPLTYNPSGAHLQNKTKSMSNINIPDKNQAKQKPATTPTKVKEMVKRLNSLTDPEDATQKQLSKAKSTMDLSAGKKALVCSKIPLRKAYPSIPCDLNVLDLDRGSAGGKKLAKSVQNLTLIAPKLSLPTADRKLTGSIINLDKPPAGKLALPRPKPLGRSIQNLHQIGKRVQNNSPPDSNRIKTSAVRSPIKVDPKPKGLRITSKSKDQTDSVPAKTKPVEQLKIRREQRVKSDQLEVSKAAPRLLKTDTFKKTATVGVQKGHVQPRPVEKSSKSCRKARADTVKLDLKKTQAFLEATEPGDYYLDPEVFADVKVENVINYIQEDRQQVINLDSKKVLDYSSDNSDDSGNISNELELDCEETNSSSSSVKGVAGQDSGVDLSLKTESEIFFRNGVVSQLETQRDEHLAGMVVQLQAHCRGYLARRKLAQRKLQDLAVRCIQRNVRKFLAVRDWPWWRLLVRVTPLLNVHRTEEELRIKTEELESIRLKCEKLESERTKLKHDNDKLEAKLSEMTVDLAEEHSTATLAAERLDAETSERLKLEQELTDVQGKNKELQQASERLELELLYSRSDLNGISEEDEDGDADGVYKQRYERAVKELEFTKRRLQQQHEDDLEQLVGLKKQLEKKLADAYEEVEEQRQVVGQWKRKVQKLNGEMNDLRLLLEEQSARNNLLEKKQRKFDSETQMLQDELKKERQAKDRFAREKEVLMAEKYTIESTLADTRLELELKEEKLGCLQREFEEITCGGKTEEEVTILRKQRMDCERKLQDQEEELDELAGQVQLLEQAKLRLEMSLESMRKEAKKEAQMRDEELEDARCNAQKKVKGLEVQLENEHEERTLLLREKHELERRLAQAAESERHDRAGDEALLQRLKRDLKRTKALLRDTQTQLERQKAETPGKTLIRQLRNQVEDLECARAMAAKAKQGMETELLETQSLLEDAHRQKQEAEERANALLREKGDLQSQLEENEEELAEVLKKFKGTVQQMSLDQLALQEQVSLVSELEIERNQLREQLAELTSKLESAESMGDASSNLQVKRSELKAKELESKLELEQTTRSRLEVQITRLKEAVDKLQNEISASRVKEQQGQEQARKLQRQLREVKEELNKSLAKESEVIIKKKELEKRCETLEAECATARTDLRLALKRIEDLQSAIQGDLEDDSISDNSDSEQDSYSSDESVNTFLANHKLGPVKGEKPAPVGDVRRLSSASRSSTSSSLGREPSYT